MSKSLASRNLNSPFVVLANEANRISNNCVLLGRVMCSIDSNPWNILMGR